MSIHSKQTRHLAALALGALMIAACGGEEPADEYRNAVPTRSELSMDVPVGGGSQALSGEVGNLSQGLLGQQAELYQLTYEVSRDVNSSIWVGLNVIEAIVQYPPTTLSNNVAVWGPHTNALEPLTWRLVVSKTGPGKYAYELAARKRNTTGQFLPILAGTSEKGTSQYFGGYKGIYTANADNMNALDPANNPDKGKMIATYDTTGDKRRVEMALEDYSENGAPPADLLYSYLERPDMSGEFGFVARTDLDKNGSAEELFSAGTAWDATGAGRGDAVVTGGDIQAGVKVLITECWDASFGRTFYQDSHGIKPTEGSAASCVFSQPLK